MFKIESKKWVLPVVALSSLFVLMVDILTAKGSIEYIFFFIPIALSAFHVAPGFPIAVGFVATVLSFIGWKYSPYSESIAPEVAFMNRVYSIIAMWIVVFLVRKVIVSRNEVERSTWIKNRAADLAALIRGELTASEVAESILSFMAQETNMKVGSVFLKRDFSPSFNLIASHAHSGEKRTVALGEGLLGQVAIDKRVAEASPLSGNHVKITSALGESASTHLILVPFVADNETVGVMELAYLHKSDQIVIDLITLVAEVCAITLRSADNKAKLAELLKQSQQFTEELQAQQEELRVVNEELEQQTRALKESHVRLENQQAEMEQTNQQLEEQAQELENQKNLLNQKNTELMQSKEDVEKKAVELRRSSNFKSEFLANMSHELRTPLNSTLILAKLLWDNKPGTLTEEQTEYAQIIYNSGNDLLNLINDILDLSKVEAGKMTVTPEIVLVEQVAKNMELMLRPMAKQKQLDFKVHVDESTPHEMITDRQRLEQILKNFLSNALKFTQKGGFSLHIYPENDNVVFAVADTGVGISLEEQSVIFEAFRQADGTTNRKFGGTGLGLSISKELSRILGGEISVRSEKGHGSTFTLSLPVNMEKKTVPVKRIEEVKPSIQVKTPPPPEKSTFTLKDDRDTIQSFTRRMLIIEDDEAFAKILYDHAREMGFGAIVAESGEEGLHLAKTYQPNAIVLDIRLPDHSGMIVLDHLKMNTKTRHIPVHVISSEDFSRSALEMGAIGYMLKPVKKEQLQDAFKNLSTMLDQKVKHVLIVEDDSVQRNHIKQLISDKTVEVTAVETSREALDLLSQRTFDCMIMDLSLPDMSGHELLSRLSNESSVYSFPPVIVYTARDLTPQEEEKLRLYSGSIIIKGAKSPERLLSEVTLFLHKVETDLPPERQKMLKDLRSREKSLEGRTMLIVDDDVRNIFALSSALETNGAKIQTARNGREAIEKLDASIDLVLMDIMMPEMDGYEAMTRIRKNPEFQNLPIIALTAKAMKDDKEKCLEAGANDYLPKPIEMDKLLSLIRVWLPQKRRFS